MNKLSFMKYLKWDLWSNRKTLINQILRGLIRIITSLTVKILERLYPSCLPKFTPMLPPPLPPLEDELFLRHIKDGGRIVHTPCCGPVLCPSAPVRLSPPCHVFSGTLLSSNNSNRLNVSQNGLGNFGNANRFLGRIATLDTIRSIRRL